MAANFNHLWDGVSCSVVVKRKDLQDFIMSHECNGKILIFVRGCGRYVKWKNIGAGMYHVYTEEK
jgi:hypothetical protein